jgi:hypothetical protein
MSNNFWTDPRVTAAVGLLLGLLANKLTEYLGQLQSYLLARKLKGEWTAHNMKDGRHVDRENRMHDQLTKIEPCRLLKALSSESHVLQVSAVDPDGRAHSGPLVIDADCSWFARRVVLYSAMDELYEQKIVISPDQKTLYVFPVSTVATLGPKAYNIHALCKKE